MADYILRLLEDRLEGGARATATAAGNRMTYCESGGVSLNGEMLAANQVANNRGYSYGVQSADWMADQLSG